MGSTQRSSSHEELVVQSEALKRAQSALEETRDEFIELYDFAPTGYVTLDANGVICRCNLAAASFLGRLRPALEGLPLMGFVSAGGRPAYLEFLRRCRAGETYVETELPVGIDDRQRHVQLLCRPGTRTSGDGRYFTSIIDITERKELEHERMIRAGEHEALASRLLVALDDERARIARNLHDDIGQQLTAVRLKLEHVRSVGDAATPAALDALQLMIANLDQRLHFVATELRPASLDLGLVTAVEHFVHDWSAAFSITADVHAQGVDDGVLGPEVETHLYRILQEALNNVSKHAEAHHVTVQLEGRDAELVLVVEDDGRGFDLHRGRRNKSALGLIGMRERAQMVGGLLEIESAPGHGTSVFVHVPQRRAGDR